MMAPSTPDPLLRLMSLSDATLESPFPELDVELSGVSLRETAYEILVAASGITALSARTRPSKNKTGFTGTAVRLKKALLKTRSGKVSESSVSRGKHPPSIAETIRFQMEISEQSDDRTRRALIAAAVAHANRPVEAMLIPLELLQNIKPSQFTDRTEYTQWRLRQLRVLTAGLVLHPAIQEETEDGILSDRLQQMLVDLAGNAVETGKKSEAWQALRIAAIAKAGRVQNGESPRAAIHWADGFPLNVHLYNCLLSSCFDTLDEALLIGEFDEVLEWIRKTWGILGINQMLHSLCFMWVLFGQFIKTGESEADLLLAAEEQMKEAAAEAKLAANYQHSKQYYCAVSTILAWAEKRLSAYHEMPRGIMVALLPLALTAARIVKEDEQTKVSPRKKKDLSGLETERVDQYIRSSMKAAVSQKLGAVDKKRKGIKNGEKPQPVFAVLAGDIGALAVDERKVFSPLLKQWHPSPAGVSAAVLHNFFGKELKLYMSGITGISRDVVEVLQAADKLETDLVQMAVEDGVDAEDGGKSLISSMVPYEAPAIMDSWSKKWVEEGVGRLSEWAGRNIQNEQWKPKATREGYAPSAVEVLRIVEETMDAFFFLPISKDPVYVKVVVLGVSQGIEQYCQKTLAGCGKKEHYIPALPALTRYDKKASTQKGGWRSVLMPFPKTKMLSSIPSLPRVRSSDLANLCVRINTLNHLSNELQYLDKRLKYGWLKDVSTMTNASESDTSLDTFQETRAELEQAVKYLIDLAAYKVIFYDLRGVFWEGLYAGSVESARISQVLDEVDPQLGVIADIASEHLRNRIVAALMKACLDCLVLVLLAGGPSRAFTVSDSDTLENDLILLKDLFKAEGDGLPAALVENAAASLQKVLTLFHMSSDKLILALRASYPDPDGSGSSRHSKVATLPRTTGDWSPGDPNTILRVLCYRADDTASQYLKKHYNLSKKLPGSK